MVASGFVSVPSGVGQSVNFTVYGAHTLAFATQFAQTLIAAEQQSQLDKGQTQVPGAPGVEFIDMASGATSGVTTGSPMKEYVLSAPGGTGAMTQAQILLDVANGATSVTGSGLGDTVLAAAINGGLTYTDIGGNNVVTFATGNNTYIGDTASGSSGSDTVVAGSGNDTVKTGSNNTTVLGGVGHGVFSLNDTAAATAGSYNDVAVLDEGSSQVIANGTNDLVFANAGADTIYGESGNLSVVFGGAAGTITQTGDPSQMLNAGSGLTTVWDDSNGNAIFGGTGNLLADIGSSTAGVSATIAFEGGATGQATVFGHANDTINYYGAGSATSPAVFVANEGTETFSASNSAQAITFFGSSVAGTTDNVTGGAGNDVFLTGIGSTENLAGGAGNNTFLINDDGKTASHITITDFGASSGNMVGFVGANPQDWQNAVDNATVSGSGSSASVNIQLSDGTTVTFDGVSSLSGHII